ncbi:MAG: BON domain-containing protein [Ktedonobacterales bacterium]|nr:BON domain-containing protein [Ktedonobacterales bacterium]
MISSKIVLRLGANAQLDEVASLPERLRGRLTALRGKLGSVFLVPETGDLWCRLSSGVTTQVWPPTVKRVDARTFPLNARQTPTPSPDALELFPQMFVESRDGYVGKLEGLVLDAATGTATGLLIRIRRDLADVIVSPEDPLAELVEVQGQRLLISHEWAKSPETVRHALGVAHHLKLDATAPQVASGLHLRDDADLQHDVYAIIAQNPALATYISALRVTVHDGAVRVSGVALSPRLRASMEQDIWHVPGVLAVRTFGA